MQVAEVVGLCIALHILLQGIAEIAVSIHLALLKFLNHEGRVPRDDFYLVLVFVDVEEYLAHIQSV